jgi:hypothetical protein
MGKFNEVQQWKDLRMIEVKPICIKGVEQFYVQGNDRMGDL